jgi:hypothetical protein
VQLLSAALAPVGRLEALPPGYDKYPDLPPAYSTLHSVIAYNLASIGLMLAAGGAKRPPVQGQGQGQPL